MSTLHNEEITDYWSIKNIGFNFFFTFCDPSGQPH